MKGNNQIAEHEHDYEVSRAGGCPQGPCIRLISAALVTRGAGAVRALQGLLWAHMLEKVRKREQDVTIISVFFWHVFHIGDQPVAELLAAEKGLDHGVDVTRVPEVVQAPQALLFTYVIKLFRKRVRAAHVGQTLRGTSERAPTQVLQSQTCYTQCARKLYHLIVSR